MSINSTKSAQSGVQKELEQRGIASDVVSRMMELITSQRPGTENLDYLESVLGDVADAQSRNRRIAPNCKLSSIT